jgi:glycosyltransferase involved in cell wall biosynthesis
VQPTKAEGWGLPILEALACGIPAIATNYSGHTDFLNDANGYLVDVARMIEVDDPFFYNRGGPFGEWAQPDLDHLQVLMRRSFENPEERRRKGAQGRRDVIERWTWKDAAKIAHCRLHGV